MANPYPAAERSFAASIGAYESWARTPDRTERTANGRKAFLDRFEQQVDPDGVLDSENRRQRAEALRKAYFRRLALKSAQSRRRSRELAEEADAADAELSADGAA